MELDPKNPETKELQVFGEVDRRSFRPADFSLYLSILMIALCGGLRCQNGEVYIWFVTNRLRVKRGFWVLDNLGDLFPKTGKAGEIRRPSYDRAAFDASASTVMMTFPRACSSSM